MTAPTSKRILFANNGTSKDQSLLDVLVQLNYEVVLVSNFQNALEASKSDGWSLILASVDEPANGVELCGLLRGEKATQKVPVLLMDVPAGIKPNVPANGLIPSSAPPEDLVDWVERLIGLPAPPDSDHDRLPDTLPLVSVGSHPDKDKKALQNEIEELQEKVAYYQQQVRDVSVSGEKSARDMAQVLHDMQDDLEKGRLEKQTIKDELELLKSSLAEKERDTHGKDKLLEDLKTEADRQQSGLKRELDELRSTLADSEQKHKRALSALREYYKGKTGQTAVQEKKVQSLEADVKKLKEELAKSQDLLNRAKKLFS